MIVREKKERFAPAVMILAGILVAVGVLLRDTAGIEINKFLFLLIAAVPLLCLKIEYSVVFAAFLIPLYVGLPGNYISMVLLLRLLLEYVKGKIKLDFSLFLASVAVTLYLVITNVFWGSTSVYHLMGSIDFVVLALFASATLQYEKVKPVILAFSIGVAVVGVSMLSATLQYYSLAELMSDSSRLGYTGMLGEELGEEAMIATIDPNFYGMNVIALASCGYLFLTSKGEKKGKIFMAIALLVALAICLIGLSRTFLLALVIWAVLALFTETNIKRAVGITVTAGVLVVAFALLFPQVVDGFARRFSESDIMGANGRFDLIHEHASVWSETIPSVFFGGGLYNNNTHCAPLLYLYGVGLVGMALLIWWFGRILVLANRSANGKGVYRLVPFLVTFLLFSTIPAAGALNYTFPLFVSMMAVSVAKERKKNEI